MRLDELCERIDTDRASSPPYWSRRFGLQVTPMTDVAEIAEAQRLQAWVPDHDGIRGRRCPVCGVRGEWRGGHARCPKCRGKGKA